MKIALLLALLGVWGMSFAQDSVTAYKVVPKEGSNVKSGNSLLFMGPGPAADAQFAEMRKRLADPELRKALRAETREQTEHQNPDLAEVLGLDDRARDALLELLTDQQMKHLDFFYARNLSQPQSHEDIEASQRGFASEETRKNQEIRAQLGEEGFDRYLEYQQTRVERMQVARFDERLTPPNKLTTDQKQRLMELWRTDFEQSMAKRSLLGGGMLPRMGTRGDFESAMQKSLIESMEDNYRRMQADSRAFLAKLPAVLTPAQVAEYTKMEDERLASQRRYTEDQRAAAGLSREFADGPPAPPPEGRVPVTGRVRIAIWFRTNEAEPVQVEFTIENGKPTPAFDASEGLWVEATPLLYADGWANIEYRFYEDRNGQRRALPGKLGSGVQADVPRNYALGLGGGGGSIVTGSKAYSIRMDARVSPAE